ncbi:MAG: hypothetical protein NVSMB63_14470 [Sediminibacterium sp.]
MKKSVAALITGLFLVCLSGFAQKITYSETDREDARTLNFEITGKMNGRILVYKNYRDLHFMTVYDNDMKMVERNRLDFFPDRVLNAEFLQYPGFVYVIYQYQKRSILYCMAAKLDASGKKTGDPVLIDTTSNINFSASNKIYSVISSEDKQRIMVFKINSRNDRSHLLTTCLFDRDLTLLKKTRMSVNMPQRNDFLTEFSLDNEGDMACIRASGTSQNDNINKITLITKPAAADNFLMTDLRLNNLFLDDIRIKVDNINKHYLITSFFSKNRRGNIEGLYYYLWDKPQAKELLTAATAFSEEFRADARNDGNVKAAFNDYFLKNIVLRKDGGFLIVAEAAYTTSRGNALSRWDYLYGSPYWAQTDYYYFNNPIGYYPWRSSIFNTTLTRYFADNIAVISFDPSGKMEWSNVIRKSQYDDNTDNFIGYGLVNSGDQLHFLFNVQEKRDMILSDQTISPSGQINRNPTFKNLDKGYDFMPRHAKQVGARQMIIPCQYRGFTCFAKVEF